MSRTIFFVFILFSLMLLAMGYTMLHFDKKYSHIRCKTYCTETKPLPAKAN